MTKNELIFEINRLAQHRDPESAHGLAEEAVLKFINDPEITEAWSKAAESWWYA